MQNQLNWKLQFLDLRRECAIKSKGSAVLSDESELEQEQLVPPDDGKDAATKLNALTIANSIGKLEEL